MVLPEVAAAPVVRPVVAVELEGAPHLLVEAAQRPAVEAREAVDGGLERPDALPSRTVHVIPLLGAVLVVLELVELVVVVARDLVVRRWAVPATDVARGVIRGTGQVVRRGVGRRRVGREALDVAEGVVSGGLEAEGRTRVVGLAGLDLRREEPAG